VTAAVPVGSPRRAEPAAGDGHTTGAPKLEVLEVTKRYGSTVSVDHASFQVAEGEFFTLLGPSGCCKSTILGMIAGIVESDAGRICLDGRDITRQPIRRRDVALVFQNYALFPHMTVRDNVAFGLKMRGTTRAETAGRVEEALCLVRLQDQGNKYPRQLSGGQQQRVALARAIVVRPKILLLDEPLSNLDAKLRIELRSEMREIQRSIGQTTVFVTHDLAEAFEMSDRIAVMSAGRIQQIGSPAALYARPASLFVAEFLGQGNCLAGTIVADGVAAGAPTLRIRTDQDWTLRASLQPDRKLAVGDAVWLVLPTESLKIIEQPGESDMDAIPGTIIATTFLGGGFRYTVRCSGTMIHVETRGQNTPRFRNGDEVHLQWRPGDAILVTARGDT
jgi:ABC-type Fe3+/spermidine/putrescine transport system ATPase subunit